MQISCKNISEIADKKTASQTFAIVCLGCKVNRAEVDEISAKLLGAGWCVGDVCDADAVVVNTCTVTHVADKKTRQAVRRVCSECENTDARIIVTGCAAVMQPEIYTAMNNRVEVVGKAEVVSKLCGTELQSTKVPDNLQVFSDRSRASFKIQDGCNNACSYCIVHTARGKANSLPADEVMQKFNALLNAGYREIVLSGVDLGAYSCGDIDLAQICEAMVSEIDNYYSDLNSSANSSSNSAEFSDVLPARIRISSIEPQSVTDSLIKLLASSQGKICRHLHLPLQSGSTKVLQEMNRHYSAEEYLALVEKLQALVPQISLSTDIIVGFPGETEEDFAATCDVARKCGFMKIHVFPYSKREGTPAAERSDQVPEEVKATRARILREISEKLRLADLQKRGDTSEFVLVETTNKARTESYHLVNYKGKCKIGQLDKIKL